MTTRRTVLSPPDGAADLRFVHNVLTDPRNSGPFTWRGSTPSVGDVVAELDASALISLIVRSSRTGDRLGFVFLSNPDLRNGHAFMVAAADPERKGTGVTIEGLFGLVHLAFTRWPFHKLYADVDEIALRSFRSAVGRYLTPEGRFRQHHYRDGCLVDVYRLALYRSDWDAGREAIERRMRVAVIDAWSMPGR